MWITLNEPQQAAHQGYRVGTHAPGKTDLTLAAAATHHLLLAHGLAIEAIRAELSGHIPVGISIDLHPVRALDEDAAHAAAALDGEQNRIFLEPVLHGSYPDTARAELLPAEELIEPGDMDRISAPLDFLGLNYYCPYYVRTGDWNDLRQGESPLPGTRAPSATCRRTFRTRAWAGSSSPRASTTRSERLIAKRRDCLCTSPRTAARPTTTSTPTVGSTTPSESTIWKVTSRRHDARSTTASTSPATSSGR